MNDGHRLRHARSAASHVYQCVPACPNACLFRVDIKGDTFYGLDLKTGRALITEEIVPCAEERQIERDDSP